MRTLHVVPRPGPTSGKEYLNGQEPDGLELIEGNVVLRSGGDFVALQHVLPGHLLTWLRELVPIGAHLAEGTVVPSPGCTTMKRWTAEEMDASGAFRATQGRQWLTDDVLDLLGLHWPGQGSILRKQLDGRSFQKVYVKPNSVAPLHRDEGPRTMVILRTGNTHGGHLALPELGVKLAVPDAALILMDGKRWAHGVTPIMGGLGGGSRTACTLWP